MTENIDIIIIGGGPAGLTAGLYTQRSGIKTLLLEKTAPGGLIAMTEKVENYPGFPGGINGFELTKRMEDQAKEFGLEIQIDEVSSLKQKSPRWEVITAKQTYSARAIIIATGNKPRKLDVPGESEFVGKGVSYCATCDGPFYKDKEVVVVGGGDAALEEALLLTKFARQVWLVHRRNQFRASQILQDRVLKHAKIKPIWNSVIQEIIGSGPDKLKAVRIKNQVEDKVQELPIDGVFIFIGYTPEVEFLKGLITFDAQGYIVTNEELQTSQKGIYACGDARKKTLRQVVTACGEGALAAFNAARYLGEIK